MTRDMGGDSDSLPEPEVISEVWADTNGNRVDTPIAERCHRA
jgi:hypothetical protein